jgi:hypothetical protein
VDTYFRIASKASYDGICALENNYNGTNPNCTSDPAGPNFRQMIDPTTVSTWGACAPTIGAWSTSGLLASVPVTVGASDVQGESFLQQSHGLLLGPLGSTQTDRVFSGMPTTAGLNTPYTLAECQPLIVPFAFYVNTSVQECIDTQYVSPGGVNLAPDPSNPPANPLNWHANHWAPWASCVGDPTGVRYKKVQFRNMPRIKAVLIFSGQIYNWTDLGSNFVPNLPVAVCMRHAGSGTHATLDLAVMNKKWGGTLAQISCNNGRPADPMCLSGGTPPTIFFNNGSKDEINCINGSGAWSGNGAVGYSDADYLAINPAYDAFVTTGAHTIQMTYNGETANRHNIRMGEYDFWTNENMYFRVLTPWLSNLCTFASTPANIPASEAEYWTSQCEMNYTKVHDTDYPAYSGASCPQE